MFSIVIPTRNRPNTLPSTLRTCLDQDFEDFEIVVFDNASDPETRRVVQQFSDPRIRFVHHPSALPMTASWNQALSHARGNWIVFIGDDDGLCPGALRVLAEHISEYPEIRTIRWLWGAYTWPNIEPASESNRIRVPLFQDSQVVDSRERLLEMLTAPGGPLVPHTYHALMHRSVIDRVLEKGAFFDGPYPDVASGTFSAMVTDRFLEIGQPLSFLGYSPTSTTMAQRSADTNSATASEFDQLNLATRLHAHPDLPDAIDLAPITYWDAVFRARDRFAPLDPEFVLDPFTICQTALDAAIVSGDRRDRQVRAVCEWWEANKGASTAELRLPDETAGFEHERLVDTPGIYSDSVVIDGNALGVTDAFGAAEAIGRALSLKPTFEQIAAQHDKVIVDREVQYRDLVGQIEVLTSAVEQLQAKAGRLQAKVEKLQARVAKLKSQASTPGTVSRVRRKLPFGK